DSLGQELSSQSLESKLILTGHSLGGHLAQVFVLLYADNVKELYTYTNLRNVA
ncbi:hypothetical protein CQA53_12070, partial [Helicobacter didelphidarum]